MSVERGVRPIHSGQCMVNRGRLILGTLDDLFAALDREKGK
jgi:hypothetical protein